MTHKMSRREFLKLAGVTAGVVTLAACGTKATVKPTEKPTVGAPPAAAVTLEFWTFNDYAVGVALDLFNTYIKEFQDANPGIKVNLTGKPGTDILTGLVTGAGSGQLPDSVQIQLGSGGDLIQVGALADLAPYYKGLSDDYKAQFNQPTLALCIQGDKVWGFPFSAYATILYRNLKLLKKAGIDPTAGVKDWADYKSQLEKVKAAGAMGQGKVLASDWIQKHFYGGVPGAKKDTIAADGKSTTLEADKYAILFQYLLDLKPYTAGSFMYDQPSTDLFISDGLAFITMGPWLAPTFEDAKTKSGLEYDAVLIPGQTTNDKGSVKGGEFTGVMPTKNVEQAFKWATYVSDWPQETRWTAKIGRIMANDKALAQPDAKANWLAQVTYEAYKYAMSEGAFMKKIATGWSQPEIDYGTQVDTGVLTPVDAAKKMIDDENKILSGG